MKNRNSCLSKPCPYVLTTVLTLLVLVAFSQKKKKQAATSPRPNIVFIMSDDHAYQAISAYDTRLIQTPNIDRIAKEGILFTNASVTNSICAPSRAVILTGKHSHINGKIDNNFPFDTTQVTFPQLLQQDGYQTAMFGKLHFGNSPKGFDQYKILPGQGVYYNPEFITKNEGTIQVEGYVTDIITEMSLDWLQTERDPSKPFFLMYLHKAPHRSWEPALRHLQEYTQKTFPEPETLFDTHEKMGTAAQTAEMDILHSMSLTHDNKVYEDVMKTLLGKDSSKVRSLPKEWKVAGQLTPDQKDAWDAVYRPISEDFARRYPDMTDADLLRWKYQRYLQDYLGCLAAVDEGVGKVLDYLEESGLAENTIVVYTSDQGFYLGEHGWFDKRFIYDESFKTPLLIRWPGVVKAGTVSTEMVQNLDFAETFLEAAGVSIPQDMQGQSMVPLLKGDQSDFRDAAYYHYYEYPAVHMVKRHYGIVTEAYKLVHFYYDTDEWELYDRKKDPQETTNVYQDPAYAQVVKQLTERLQELRKQYQDNDDLDEYYIQLYEDHHIRGIPQSGY